MLAHSSFAGDQSLPPLASRVAQTEGAQKGDPAFASYADACESYPGSIDYSDFVGEGPSTTPVEEEDPDEPSPTPAPVDETSTSISSETSQGAEAASLQETVEKTGAGVNGLLSDAGGVFEISTNSNAGGGGMGDCGVVLPISKVLVEHDRFSDSTTEVESLFDGDMSTYYSINRESTAIILQLEEMSVVNGVSLGFFMKFAEEERIQTFDIDVRGPSEDDDWVTVYSREESSGKMEVMQTFPFTATEVYYVRFVSHGNTFNK